MFKDSEAPIPFVSANSDNFDHSFPIEDGSNYAKVMKVTVLSGKGEKARSTQIELPQSATVKDLKKKYADVIKKSIHRLSFKAEAGGVDKNGNAKVVRLDDDSRSVDSYGLGAEPQLQFKDLGPQIGYRFVFLVEYLGPMLFVGLWYLRPSFVFGADAVATPYNWVASLGVGCWMVHFLKRELETLFVHKFSRPTMPLQNLFKNCTYYWTFGAVIGYPLCHPQYAPPSSLAQVYAGLALFAVSEVGNLICHLMLSNMRPKEGSQKREIPSGFLFNYVACPNYTFEVLSWVGFSVMTQIPAAYLFTLVGFLQMADWARKKHANYKKTYDTEYTKLRRKAIIPFVY